MSDDLGIGLGRELGAFRLQFMTQFAKILDDAVVNDRQFFRGVRMGIILGRAAVRCPARVTDADRAG